MRSCLYYLCRDKAVYDRVEREVEEFYAANELTTAITYTQTQTLPYLRAVVAEATRLLPSIVFNLLRYTPADGMTIDGKYIPGGTPIGISPIAQNRDRKIWGDDANEFRPERWLESEAQKRHFEAATMTFGGSGPRTCVGKNIALVSHSSRSRGLSSPYFSTAG